MVPDPKIDGQIARLALNSSHNDGAWSCGANT